MNKKPSPTKAKIVGFSLVVGFCFLSFFIFAVISGYYFGFSWLISVLIGGFACIVFMKRGFAIWVNWLKKGGYTADEVYECVKKLSFSVNREDLDKYYPKDEKETTP